MEVSHDDSFSCYFSCCLVPWFLLGGSVILSLLVCFSRKILQGRLLPERRACPLSAGAWPKSPQAHPTSRDRPQATVKKAKGNAGRVVLGASRDPSSPKLSLHVGSLSKPVLSFPLQQLALFSSADVQGQRPGQAQDGPSPRTPRQDPIRHLLCADPACTLCDRVAVQARRLAYPRGRGLPSSPAPLDPNTSCLEYSSCLDMSKSPASVTLLRSDSEPGPAGNLSLSTPGAPLAPCTGPHQLRTPKKPRAAKKAKQEGLRGLEECMCCSDDWAEEQAALSTSTFTFSEISFTSRTDYSSSSARSRTSLEVTLRQVSECSLRIESSTSSRLWGEPVEEEAFGRKRKSPGTSPSRGRPKRRGRAREKGSPVFCRKRGSLRAEFAPTDTPFLKEAARAILEWHVLWKRAQHALGLPQSLLRSLRAFMPAAPGSAPRKATGEVVAVTQPQAPSFLSEDSRAGLEKHLQKMVRLKRWGLPQRVREALQHMHPAAPRKVLQSEGRGLASSGAGGAQQEARGVSFRPAGASPVKLPPPAQKMPASLLKPFPLGWKYLQPTSHPHPQAEGERVALAPERARLQVALPSRHGAPRLQPPAPPLPALEFVAPTALDALETHALQRRLQHQWGLPGLLQRSLQRFLPAPPPRPPTRRLLVPRGSQQVRPAIGQLPCIPPETKRLLESHLKRVVIERRWGLPRRVLESLQHFRGPSPPPTIKPRDREKVSWPHGAERLPPQKLPALPERGAASSPEKRWGSRQQALQRQVAKKALETQLGLFSPVVRLSQELSRRVGREALPRVLPRGLRPLRPRSQAFPFLEESALQAIELNLVRKQLAYRWGLPTLYRRSVALLVPGPPLSPAASTTAARFAATETLFVGTEVRGELEWHVRRKQVQHTWGLPGLVQRSLRNLLLATPQLCRQRRGQGTVTILQERPLFLRKETRHKLELNVRKRVVLQRWGLPKLVLESLRFLFPEMRLQPPRKEAAKSPLALPEGRSPGDRDRGGYLGAFASVMATPRKAHLVVLKHQKMEQHVAKRSVEVLLGVFPPVAQLSWRLASLSTRPLLPRPIRPGQGALRPHSSSFLPFVRPEDVGQIELAVCRSHLASLWGLGVRYTEVLRVVLRGPPTRPLAPQQMGQEFLEAQTPFLAQSDRGVLELCVRKRRLQHLWGLPALIQRSLRAFMQGSPLLLAGRRARIQVVVLEQELLFLPGTTCNHLELHLQKMKLQRQWGLPRRVLQSLKIFAPSGLLGEVGRGRPWTQRPPQPPLEQLVPIGGVAFPQGSRGQFDIQEKAEEEEENIQQEEEQESGEGSLSGKEVADKCSSSSSPESWYDTEEAPTSHEECAEYSAPRPASCAHQFGKGSRTCQALEQKVLDGDRALQRTQPRSEGKGEQGDPPQFLPAGESILLGRHRDTDKNLSLLGSIVEKKLGLQQGIHIWLHDQGRQTEGSLPRGHQGPGLHEDQRHAKEMGAQHHWGAISYAGEAVTVKWEETQCCFSQVADSAGQAGEEAQGLGSAPTPKVQLLQAGRMESHVRLEESSVRAASWMPSEMGRGRSGARGTRPTTRGEGRGTLSQDGLLGSGGRRSRGKEKTLSSKEQSLRSREQRSSSRSSSIKERRSSSREQRWRIKEQRSSSKEQRSSSKEQRSSSREQRSSSREQRSSSREQRSSSKEQRSSSREQRWRIKEQRWRIKEQRSSSRKKRSKIGAWIFCGRKQKSEGRAQNSSKRRGRSRSQGQSKRGRGGNHLPRAQP
ncbi:protein FAM205A [Podarcis raffonei]|uniref:protein FAM205A n=1 Tax=Podarcis raffonei TaxID=65483 RepID=UPI0023292BC8|nr:protein FAM205A [Podarcis raffonei]